MSASAIPGSAGSASPYESFEAGHRGSFSLSERAHAVFPAGVNHNLRATRPYPIYYSRASGSKKHDVDGNTYLDYQMGAAALLLGHNDPGVRDSLRAGAEGWLPATCTELEVHWGELVCEIVPSAERVRFLSSGTEATMLAIRLARAFTDRTKILRLAGHYHGWHDYLLSGYRSPYQQSVSAGIPEVVSGEAVTVFPDDGSEALAQRLSRTDIAAVILEPSGASWGTVPLPDGFLRCLRACTTKYGSLLIFDEMISGFRFAPGGIQERDDVLPDLTILGKILTGGLPGGAVAGRLDVLELLNRSRARDPYVFHYGTFNGHPLAAAAGIAMLEAVRTGEPQTKADAHAQEVRDALSTIVLELGIGARVYGESSCFHVYLDSAEASGGCAGKAPGTCELLGIPTHVVDALQLELRLRGVDLMSYTGGVASAAHTKQDVDHCAVAFEGALRRLRDSGVIASA